MFKNRFLREKKPTMKKPLVTEIFLEDGKDIWMPNKSRQSHPQEQEDQEDPGVEEVVVGVDPVVVVFLKVWLEMDECFLFEKKMLIYCILLSYSHS